ncbi:fructosamine kinase family protein [Thermoactinomyces mirandus]|uniref:Fructosamine kinase family protein n=1 Tax=Thermoactinomyces mirandus TaxID=2756294 RepID=A0A7W1XPQ6_9BACL|nr:fructosamine kinase family protein [Thermoactinomyces mirandus]MBA4600946.1 fructosamine kinase family protein [Thermoactinomyces mirandus]
MDKLMLKALRQIQDQSGLLEVRPVSGGDINRACQVKTGKRQYFVKMNQPVSQTFFQKEINGLTAIAQTHTLPVPQIYGTYYDPETKSALLMLEWVQGNKTANTNPQLGRGLARLHQVKGQAFGFKEDNFIGSLPQHNPWTSDWITFYHDQRLKVQYELGIKRQTILGKRRKKLEKLIDRLDQWLPLNAEPSLIHGDLWGGNWIAGKGGRPYLIDPAVNYAHYELEIAFTELFGGFSPSFYDCYQEVQPLDKNYHERKPLYQLYYLLVHLNLFGESYGSSVDRVLNTYV